MFTTHTVLCSMQPLEKSGNWPWCNTDDGGARISNADNKYRFCLTSLRRPSTTCVGFARRRVGRGGRVVLDRVYTPLDDHWSEMYKGQDPASDNDSSNNKLFDGLDNW